MKAGLLAAALGALAAGCAPVPPVYFFEGTELLRAKQVSVTAAGSLSGNDERDVKAGGMARLGVGLGHTQELRVEGAVLYPGHERDTTVSGKLSWKVAPNDWSAFIAGVGGSHLDKDSAFNVDVGLLLSPEVFPTRNARFYTGFRFGLLAPLHDVYAGAGVSGALTFPMGLSVRLGDSVRLFAEGGLLNTWSQSIGDAMHPTRVNRFTTGYGGLGLSLAFGG